MGLFSRKPQFDVFISYRRDGSAELARLLKAELEKHKINAFIDVDNLNQSYFDEQLLVRIANTSNFILVLNDNSFDRCNDPNDWLRREIEQAIKTNRRIIPVFRQGFRFPNETSLPGVLKDLPRYQSVGYSHEYHDASIQRLVHYLTEKPLLLVKSEFSNIESNPEFNTVPVQEPAVAEQTSVSHIQVSEIRTPTAANPVQVNEDKVSGSTGAEKIGDIRVELQAPENTKKIGKITIIKI